MAKQARVRPSWKKRRNRRKEIRQICQKMRKIIRRDKRKFKDKLNADPNLVPVKGFEE